MQPCDIGIQRSIRDVDDLDASHLEHRVKRLREFDVVIAY